ncbi:MAG: GHKL domain-containing protein [Defluviitaleaceae bacterium]|nr:GHKL domain-containing protein [Defluviitaleaceae bacterium]
MFAIIIGMIGNTLVAIPFTVVFDIPTMYMRESLFLMIIIAFSTFPICFFFSLYIGKRLRNSYNKLSDITKKRFVLHGCFLSIFTFLLTHINIIAYRAIEDRILLSNINIILITVIFFISVIMMAAYSHSQHRQMEAEFKSKSLQTLENFNQHLMQACDEMHRFRHDHLNLLHSFLGFADDHNNVAFKSHLIKTLTYAEETLKNLDGSSAKLKFIHIPEISGLLSVKFAYAVAQDIDVRIDIAEVVEDIPVNKLDLCRMLGIMLDNAIEELLSKEYESRVLKFGVILNTDDIMIICSNTCKTPPDVAKIFLKGYSDKGLGRGLGLYNLKETSKLLGNVVVTTRIKCNEFVLALTIRK